ncbi:MAG: hypothetical protein ACI8RZ_002198 [Myxococcota bacterium]|jgi:hypothetical protein
MQSDWPPPLPTKPLRAEQPPTRLARQLLAESGGIAGTRYIRDRLVALQGTPLSLRQTRDLLRSPQIEHLGAGYFATRDTVFEPVLSWTERALSASGPQPIDALIITILDHYPRGDAEAVRRWLSQEPGRLQRDGDCVRFTPQHWRAR